MYMRVWCSRCGDYYEVYSRDDVCSTKARTCPHCQERVSATAWAKITEAFEAWQEANMTVYTDSKAKTRYTVDFIDDSIFKNCRQSPILDDVYQHNLD